MARSTLKPEAAARLLELIQMRLISGAIHVVAALGVADLLADGPKSSDELASATGASVQPLRRAMRALAGFGVFSQDSDGRLPQPIPCFFGLPMANIKVSTPRHSARASPTCRRGPGDSVIDCNHA